MASVCMPSAGPWISTEDVLSGYPEAFSVMAFASAVVTLMVLLIVISLPSPPFTTAVILASAFSPLPVPAAVITPFLSTTATFSLLDVSFTILDAGMVFPSSSSRNIRVD